MKSEYMKSLYFSVILNMNKLLMWEQFEEKRQA